MPLSTIFQLYSRGHFYCAGFLSFVCTFIKKGGLEYRKGFLSFVCTFIKKGGLEYRKGFLSFVCTFIKRGGLEYRKVFFCGHGFWFVVFNATFNSISVISWRSFLLVEETGVPG